MREILQAGVVVVCAALLAAACSGPDTTPTPTVTPSPPVEVERPLDLSRYNERPCDAVPDSVDGEFQFEKRETEKDLHVIPAGVANQPACVLTRQGDYPRLTVALSFDVGPIESWNPRSTLMQRTDDLRGYPAGVWKVTYTTPAPGQWNLCSTFVDVAKSQGIDAAYNAGEQWDVDACALSRTAAELVLGKLTSS